MSFSRTKKSDLFLLCIASKKNRRKLQDKEKMYCAIWPFLLSYICQPSSTAPVIYGVTFFAILVTHLLR